MVIASLTCSECGRPIIYAEAELATAPPCCPACPGNSIFITEEYVNAAWAEAQEVFESEEYRLWEEECEREDAERQADPVAVRADADAEEAAHNRQLAKECLPGWSVVALYEQNHDEKGWLYIQPSGRFKVKAPGGHEAILDLKNCRNFPGGWKVEKRWVQVCHEYTIRAPNWRRMTFVDNWNA